MKTDVCAGMPAIDITSLMLRASITKKNMVHEKHERHKNLKMKPFVLFVLFVDKVRNIGNS